MFRRLCWPQAIENCLCLLSILMFATIASAQNTTTESIASLRAAATAFRVDTDIYLDVKNPKPDRQTLTLFKDGVYYDFPMDDGKQSITMIDPLGKRLVMLNPARQIKTKFSTDELASHIAKLADEVARSGTKEELARLIAASKRVTFDSERNILRVGDESLTYEATMQTARDASMAQQFADFADWSARLNAIIPPSFPPFARLELNRQIASRGALPDTIQRTTKHNAHTFVVKTKLLVIASLSSDDEAKIHMVGDLLSICKDVSQADFFTNHVAQAPSTPGSRVK